MGVKDKTIICIKFDSNIFVHNIKEEDGHQLTIHKVYKGSSAFSNGLHDKSPENLATESYWIYDDKDQLVLCKKDYFMTIDEWRDVILSKLLDHNYETN